MVAALTNNNRVNIPAVCRIKGRGTALLVSPGVLLTSTQVVGSKASAAHLTAVFFEGTKKAPVEAKLLPQRLYFAAVYPDYMDYCLVACDETDIVNVTPALFPLVRDEWPTVNEGDIVLLVQHPLPDAEGGDAAASDPPAQLKTFEEILRCRNALNYLRVSEKSRNAGCPAFNDGGQLVGVQVQRYVEGEGMVNRILSIEAIVKHLFANAHLPCIKRKVSIKDVWSTWYIDNDTSRIISILDNFRDEEVVRYATAKLCDHTAKPELIPSIVSSRGIPVLIANLKQFRAVEELCASGLRALWNVSVGDDANLRQIVEADGVEMILSMMEAFPGDEEVGQFGCVLLSNIASGTLVADFSGSFGERGLHVVHGFIRGFPDSSVLQKFGLTFLIKVIEANSAYAVVLLKLCIMTHVEYMAETKGNQVLLMEVLVRFIAELVRCSEVVAPGVESEVTSRGGIDFAKLVNYVIELMLQHSDSDVVLLHGNRALWGMGNNPVARVVILQHPNSSTAFQLSIPALQISSRP